MRIIPKVDGVIDRFDRAFLVTPPYDLAWAAAQWPTMADIDIGPRIDASVSCGPRIDGSGVLVGARIDGEKALVGPRIDVTEIPVKPRIDPEDVRWE